MRLALPLFPLKACASTKEGIAVDHTQQQPVNLPDHLGIVVCQQLHYHLCSHWLVFVTIPGSVQPYTAHPIPTWMVLPSHLILPKTTVGEYRACRCRFDRRYSYNEWQRWTNSWTGDGAAATLPGGIQRVVTPAVTTAKQPGGQLRTTDLLPSYYSTNLATVFCC